MRYRLIAAALFAAASMLFGTVWWLFAGGEPNLVNLWPYVGGGSALAGFVSARKLRDDAKRNRKLWRGAVAGLLVTVAATLITAALLVIAALASSTADGDGLSGFAFLATMLLYGGALLFPLAGPFGALAGTAFYWIERSETEPAI